MINFKLHKLIQITATLLVWIASFSALADGNNPIPPGKISESPVSATSSVFSGTNSDSVQVTLLKPGFKSKVTTTAPIFSWRSLPSDSLVEYRLLVARPNGKIIIDHWVGSDTVFAIPQAYALEDLRPYHWLIHAHYGQNSVKSQVWSFWIDQDVVTDLKIDEVRIIGSKKQFQAGDEIKVQVQIQNCGPEKIDHCFLILFSGNVNRNYFDYSAIRKTVALDTLELTSLELNVPRIVTLRGRVLPGLNDINVRLDPGIGFKEIYWPDNFRSVAKVQTKREIVRLKGLFIIYNNYIDPEAGLQNLKDDDLSKISKNIAHFQDYFWDHTRILQLEVDTIQVKRILRDDNFAYQNDKWGYVLPPAEVAKDLKTRGIEEENFDFVFAYYSWWNSNSSWSGYGGYTYGGHKFSNDKIYFLAQPTITGHIEDEAITTHEFIHLLDYLFENSGEKYFFSPHHRTLYTTFTNDKDYFDWILETWPSEKWFLLNHGERLVRNAEAPNFKIEGSVQQTESIALLQNYPNPFNQITTMTYKIPSLESFSSGVRVSLIIYDLLGNRIQTLLDKFQKPGTYQAFWDGRDQNNIEVATGIYFYELQVNHQRQIKKLLIIR